MFLVNEEIKSDKVRLITETETGNETEVLLTKDAISRAREQGLDLIEITKSEEHPVCRIADYGKYMYEFNKKQKEKAKKNKKNAIEVKEIRLSLNIGENDLKTKAKNARKFLEAGDKVKVSIRLKGREMMYAKLGEEVMNTFLTQLDDLCKTKDKPKLEGNNMIMILAP